MQMFLNLYGENIMGKKPLNENQVKTLRKLVAEKPLQSLLLNLGCDLMLRAQDLLQMRISSVMNESGTPKTEVKVKQKKTGKTTLSIPLSPNSIKVIKEFLIDKDLDDFIFKGQMSHFTRKPITTQQYAKIVKKWMKSLGVEDVSQYSTHSIRKSKPTLIYNKTKNVDAVRRLLGQSSVTATREYLGTSDESSLDLARTINI
jgi:integrase